MVSSTSTSPEATKVCFNRSCLKALEQPRLGWRRRAGDSAELCDRCSLVYEEGKFCETFHMNDSGWRCCETCGKQIHCGCIVSFHKFVLLDAGGIECFRCARKSFILTPNPAWPPPSLSLPSHPERIKDLTTKNWSPIAGSGPVPWRQAPSLFNGSSAKCEPQAKTPVEIDVFGDIDGHHLSDNQPCPIERENHEVCFRSPSKVQRTEPSEAPEDGNAAIRRDNQSNSGRSGSHHTGSPNNDMRTPNMSLASNSSSKTETNYHAKVAATSTRRSNSSTSFGKRGCNNSGLDASCEAHIRNGKTRGGDVRRRNLLLPRYFPRTTDQELKEISGGDHVITPLFEKILSASDAGRIGRLVLPKKCAEAYLPPISHPEGVPLEVQDLKGNHWLFQFRFWPNNNSRMYVLEGVTPCIQTLQLQAGDIVTFSRLEPDGKLVMGGRKASTASSSDQGNEAGNGVLVNGVNGKRGEIDSTSNLPAVDKSGHLAGRTVEADSSVHVKRKKCTLASKSKRIRIENEDMIDLKLTCKLAQEVIRPPPSDPKVIRIEGCEFEEYEDAPVIGRPTMHASDDTGEKIEWVQCDDCLKWRKMPAYTLLPSRWTCSANLWDPERSTCSAPQELTLELLEDLLPTVSSKVAIKKNRAAKQDQDLEGTSEGLDALANLAICEEGGPSQATTRHPRHKPGCTCIVCMQPPSGKGPKHEQTCDCTVCESLKRRFRTLDAKRRRRSQLGKEPVSQKPEQDTDVDPSSEVEIYSPSHEDVSREVLLDEPNESRLSGPTSKVGIDLNIQPQKEEELPIRMDFASLLQLARAAAERHISPQQHSYAGDGGILSGNQKHQNGLGGANSRIDADRPMSVAADNMASASTTH